MTAEGRLFSPLLIGACVIILVSFAIRASFGVFQLPIASEFGWLRVEFSLAIAIQNLAWGFGQPVFAAIAEKFGDRRALTLGAGVYALGLVLSAVSTTPLGHQVWGIVIGCGIAGTGFGVILAMVGRAASAENRSMALGIATAAGSAGQLVGPPLAVYLLEVIHWSEVFVVFAAMIILALSVLPMMRAPDLSSKEEVSESMSKMLGRAFRDPSYTLIFLGFFSCGYQLAFVATHFPAMITELCGPIGSESVIAALGISSTAQLGAWSLAIIGFANIGGTIFAAKLGAKYSKKNTCWQASTRVAQLWQRFSS